MYSAIHEMLKTTPVVKLVFGIYNAYLTTGYKTIPIHTSEAETIKSLNTEFRIYFSALNSDHCTHIFSIREAI